MSEEEIIRKQDEIIKRQIIPGLVIFAVSICGFILWILGFRNLELHAPILIIAVLGILHAIGVQMRSNNEP